MTPTVEDVLARVRGARPSGSGWLAHCPGHPDERASLSIGVGDDGKLLLHCYAHCTYEEIIVALGFVPGVRHHAGARQMTATYEYTNETGQLRYRVLRYDPKDFRPQQPDGCGGWVWNLQGLTRLPYRLPELRQAAQAGQVIYYVEGEKDVESARAVGLTATTLAGGAQAPIPDEFAGYFRGAKTVVLLPDNDSAGRQYVERVAERLTPAGIPCKLVVLPGLQPKGDLTDWLSVGGTAERLRALADQAPFYMSGASGQCDISVPAEVVSGAPAGAGPALLMTCLADVIPETVQWLWPARIPWGKLVLLEGDPGLGKSFFTLAIAAHVSGGRPIPEVPTGPPADVLIVSYEDGVADTIVPRCMAAGAEMTRIHHVDGVGSRGAERLLTLPDHIPLLQAEVECTGAKLVIIDPLAAALSGGTDSYKDQDIRRVLAPLATLADATGAAVLVVRHLRKATGGRAITAGGGSIGIIGAARVALCIGPAPEDAAQGPDTRILAVVKSNLAPIPTSLAYRLITTESGAARIEWLGETAYTADELTAAREASPGGNRSQLEDVCAMLQEILADGEVKKTDVLAMTHREGLGKRTVERAAKRLGLVVTRKGQGRDHGSYWALPADIDELVTADVTRATHATEATSRTRGTSGASGPSSLPELDSAGDFPERGNAPLSVLPGGMAPATLPTVDASGVTIGVPAISREEVA